jgi:hypothetical protein
MGRVWVARRGRHPEGVSFVRALTFAFVSVLTITTGAALAETIVVEAEGQGTSRFNAIGAALTAAIEQVSGVRIDASGSLRQEMMSASNGTDRTVSLSEEQQVETRRQTGGIVKSYDILSVEGDGGASVKAHLRVSIERFSVPGLPTQDRRRIVVAGPINLAKVDQGSLLLLRDSLNSYLVRSRRFAVLDRVNDAAYRKEMDVLRGPDVPLAETVRIGQVIGADYILLTKVREFESFTAEQVLPVTGERVMRSAVFISADFSVLEIATRQIKWAGQARFDSSGTIDAAIRSAADGIGEKVISGIFPLRVVQVTGATSVVINQGGDTVKIGDIYLANVLGDMMIDPYTREPLGRVETPVGHLRISRVDPKLSYGELVSGSIPTGDVEIILRPAPPQSATPMHQPSQNTGTRPRW